MNAWKPGKGRVCRWRVALEGELEVVELARLLDGGDAGEDIA